MSAHPAPDADELRHFFDASLDMLCIAGLDGWFKRLNHPWEETLGYSLEELKAQPYLSFVHPDDVQRTAAEATQLNEGGRTVWFENRYRCKDGGYKWLLWRAVSDVERKLIYASARDVTVQRFTENRLIEVTQLQQAILDGANFTIISARMDGVIQTFNAGAEKALGYNMEEVIGKATPVIFHEREELERRAEELSRELGRPIEPGMESMVAKARLGLPDENEWTYVRKDGSTYRARLSVTALRDAEGHINGFLGIGRNVTKLRRAERARQEMEQRLRAILDNTMAVIFMKDLKGRYLLINKLWADLFHVTQEDVLGKTDDDVFPPDMARAFQENDAKVLEAGRPMQLEEVAPHDDGPHTYLSVKFPVRDAAGNLLAVGGIATDITERKRAQDKFRSLLEAAPAAMVIMDASSKIVLVNKQVELLFGYTREEMVGQSVEMLLPERDRGAHAVDCEEFMAQAQARSAGAGVDLCALRKDGTEFPIEVGWSPMKAESGTLVSAAIHDLTERKRAEEELRRSNHDLEQFAYVASHDLQEPLRMVTSYLQLLERRYRSQLPQEAGEFIQIAVNAAGRMRALIHDLLMYSRVGTRGQPLSSADSGAALASALADLSLAITESRATVTHSKMPAVIVDAFQLGQIFHNLIGNALKFRALAPPRIHINARREGKMWTFSVKDNGIGIDPKFFERIFIIFQRLHGVDDYKGTGIGLALCKKIVEHHGGRIWVESEAGNGAAFHFTLPAAPPK